MNDTLLDLLHQCCDADAYLSLGYRCAQTGSCYDELRPIGDALWFSLPYRLGVGEVLLVYLQLILVAGVACTLWILIKKTAPSRSHTLRKITVWTMAMAMLLWQLWPTFFNTLADTPASLFLIEGVLIALLAARIERATLFLLAGLFLGSSALLRAAYFNPVCAAGLFFFLFWFYQATTGSRLRFFNTLLILGFTIPMSWQFFATERNMHQWSFLSVDQTQTQLEDHLQSAVVGYDTLLIESSYYWAPPCRPSKGVWNGLRENHPDELFCLLSQRINFYLGSYAPHTFFGHDHKNLISNGFAEDIGNLSAWTLHNIDSTLRGTVSPLGDKKASQLSPSKLPSDADAYLQSMSLIPLHAGTYRYSLWLWASHDQLPATIDVRFLSTTLSPTTQDWTQESLSRQNIELTEQPHQFFFNINNPQLGYITMQIGYFGKDQATTLAAAPKEFFAWGAMLEPATSSNGYIRSHTPLFGKMGEAPQTSGHERIFSNALLLANGLFIAISFLTLWRIYRISPSPVTIFIASLLALILGEALLILPEQRFLQASLSLHGILCCLFFLLWPEKSVLVASTAVEIT